MKRIVLAVALVCFAFPAHAITIEQALQISVALGQLNCGNRTVKEGTTEKQICEPYKWSVSTTWAIATLQQKVQEVVSKYNKVRAEEISRLARKPDGSLTEKALADFTLWDRNLLETDAQVQIVKLKRSELEPMNLQPSVIAALLPVVE